MNKVLVTGCAGYIGSILTSKLLELGYYVIGIDKLLYKNGNSISGFLGNKNFEFWHLDIRHPMINTFLEKVSCVFHLAAIVGAPKCAQMGEEARWINEVGTTELIRNLNGQRLIFPNTNSGYGIGDDELCTEESPLKPLSLYGESKCKAEEAVLKYDNSVSLRLATVFGSSFRPRFDLIVNDWTAQLFFLKNLQIYEPHFRRNFVHIQDVVRCMITMIDPKYKGVYNVGLDSANMTKQELAEVICKNLDLPLSSIKQGDGEDKDKRNYLVSNKKLLNTRFQFNNTLEDGISEIVQLCNILGYRVLKMGNMAHDNS